VNSPGGFPGGARGDNSGGINAEMLAYLQANTQDTEYLVAVPDSHTGSNLVLEVGRPVLFMGGFSGSDPVVDASDLARLVAGGELRYILYGGMQRGASGGSTDIGDWLKNNCQTVPDFTQSSRQNPGMGGDLGSSLYQCSS
jgi:4-amino-4-deoxy-L-arabinose transferase-like glycosyltransferase